MRVDDRNHHATVAAAAAAGAGAGSENGDVNVRGLDGVAVEARDGIANPERAPAPLCHRPPRNQRTTFEPERRPFCNI